ncbi:hypothetical protein [Ferrimonas futtsuensis]|uniref:hypothetical protein n=1 Tax=Ferrimonas futtsuensis TaxID=364764 RepID=UPI0004053E7C|nr:hypothetical protein [Ferrimonas futtsuensis]
MWDCPDPYADTLDSCAQSTSFDAQKAAVLRVHARRDGSDSSGELVNVFSDKGSLIPADGRVLTGEDGSALIRIQADDDEGVVAISASYADATSQMYAQINAIQVGLTLSTSLADGQVLSDGSTMAVTASLTVNGQPYMEPLSVSFSSTCALSDKAEIDEQVLSQGGEAVATYRSTGCEQQDQVTATLALGGSTATDSLIIPLASVPIASIQFVSATPDYLQLEGTGGVRTTTLLFQVLDENGQPKQGVDVALSAASGEERFSLTTQLARSDNQGMVSVALTSKNLPGPFRVKAEVVDSDPLIVAVSQELRVGTGLPDKNSFDISFSVLNPQAWRYNGVRVGINVYAADHFNNPVPDGTAISVVTEGGSVGANCLTENGICNVEWVSQDPRPDDGRVTVTAFIEGEESFDDVNGNGFYDLGEWDGDDEHEVFFDHNESGTYDDGTGVSTIEPFIDRNHSTDWDTGDGQYNGLLCQGEPLTSGDCSRELVDLGVSGVIVMSGARPEVYFCHFDALGVDADGDQLEGWFDCWNDQTDEPWLATAPVDGKVAVCVLDVADNGQFPNAPFGTFNPVPYGTTVTFVTDGDVEAVGQTSFVQRSTNVPIHHVDEDGVVRADNRSTCGTGRYGSSLRVGPGGGTLSVEVELPDGLFISTSMNVSP